MGQGPRVLSYIEPQTKVIRAMGQGPRAPSLGRAVLQRRDGFRLQERSDRRRLSPKLPHRSPAMSERRGRRRIRLRAYKRHEGHFNGATKPESIPARHRHPSRGNLLNTSASSAAHCCCPSSSAPDGYRCTRCRTPPRSPRGRGPTCARTPRSSSPPPSRGP